MPFIPETNPMAQSSPQWAKWFDMLKEQAGGRRIRMAPQPGGEGSQFRGYSQQMSSPAMGLEGETPTGLTPRASMVNLQGMLKGRKR
jgi:hypothetical protein